MKKLSTSYSWPASSNTRTANAQRNTTGTSEKSQICGNYQALACEAP